MDGLSTSPPFKLLACRGKGPWLSGWNCGVLVVFDVGPGGAGLDVCKTSACMVAGAAPGPGREEVCRFFSELIIEKGLEGVSDEV